MNDFKFSGYRNTRLSAHQDAGSSNNLISAPGSGKTIVIYDIVVADPDGMGISDQIIRNGSGGTVLMMMGEGHVGLVAPIAIGDNKPLWVATKGDADTTYAVTVTYSIESA